MKTHHTPTVIHHTVVFTGRNEVVGKVMFLLEFVILFTGGGMSASVHAGIPHPPEADPPLEADTPLPPGADTPPEADTPPGSRHPPRSRHPPGSRHQHPQDQTPPGTRPPLGSRLFLLLSVYWAQLVTDPFSLKFYAHTL